MEKIEYAMASPAQILERIVNQDHPLVERFSAIEALVACLGKPDCLQDVLDKCCGRWRDLTGLLWSESDPAMKTALSKMLANLGSAAARYARLADSVIPPNLLFAWIEPYLLKLSNDMFQPWDEAVILYMLDILRQCLTDLEGTAFRSSAPGLLNACLYMLGSKDTPIGHFGALLELLVQLTKVPACVRPKFREIIDLLVGWGVCADTPRNSRSSLSRAFQSLASGWKLNTDLAVSLLEGMATDMIKMLGPSIENNETEEFLNTGLCLALILQSSSPFLNINAMSVIPRVIQLYMDALAKYAHHDAVRDSPEFVTDICSQTKILVMVSLEKTVDLMKSVPLEAGEFAQVKQWEGGLLCSILEIAHEGLRDVADRPSEVVLVLQVHIILVAVMKQHSRIVEAEGILRKIYGDPGICFQLRAHSSKKIVRQLSAIYFTLLTWATTQIRCYFTELLLRDLQPISSFSGHGCHGLPLIPPIIIEEPKDKCEVASAIVADSPGGGGSNGSNHNEIDQTQKSMRRVLFSISLMNQLVTPGHQNECNGDEIRRIWNTISTESLRTGGILQHGAVTLKAVQLVKHAHEWLVANNVSMKGTISAPDYIGSMMASDRVKDDVQLTSWFLDWARETVEKSPAAVSSDARLVELILESANSAHEEIRIRTGEIFYKLSSTCVDLNSSTVQKLASLAANRSSDVNPYVSKIYEKVLISLSPYALMLGSEGNRYRRESASTWATIATQRQTVVFQPVHLANFLQHLAQTIPGEGSTLRLLQDTKPKIDLGTNWIYLLVDGLEPIGPVEGSKCLQSEILDAAVLPLTSINSSQALLWFLVHELARNCVNTKFRLQNGGPSQFFELLEGALSSLTTKLSGGSRVNFTNTWMLLEFISALEKHCYCGYCGSDMLPSPPEITWPFYLGNRKVFVEWFSRLHPKLIYISQKLGHHHVTVNVFIRRIDQLHFEQGNLMDSCLDEAWGERLSLFLSQLSELLMQTSLSLCKLHEPAVIRGLHLHVISKFSSVLMLPSAQPVSTAESPIGWLLGLALQAHGRFEEAVLAYNEFYTYARSLESEQTSRRSTETLRSDACHKALLAHLIAKEFQPFVRERIAECFYGTADWRGYRSFVQVIEQHEPASSTLWVKLRQINLSSVYDLGSIKDAFEKLSSWSPESIANGVDEVLDHGEILTLQGLISAKDRSSHQNFSKNASVEALMHKQASIMQILAHENPKRLAKQLMTMHKLKCAISPTVTPDTGTGPQNVIPTLFDLVSKSRLQQPWKQLGILSALVPDACDCGVQYHVISSLSDADIIGLTRVQRETAGNDLASFLLLGCHIARQKGNKRLAVRFLNDEALQSGLTTWARALAIIENREILMSDCSTEEHAKFLVQWWESMQRELQGVSTIDDTSRMVLAVSLSRLSRQLRERNRIGIAENVGMHFGGSCPSPNQFFNDHWAVIEAAFGGPLNYSSSDPKYRIIAAQAFCATAALGVSPQLPMVWKDFGDSLCNITKEAREYPEASADGMQESGILGYRHALKAYCRYWQLKKEDSDSFTLLKMVHLIHEHGHNILDDDMQKCLMTVPSTAWVAVTSQLFTKASHPSPRVRQCMMQILKAVSRVAIASVLYPAIVEKRKAEEDSECISHEMEVLLADLQMQQPGLWVHLEVMLDEMERLTMLWVQQWHATLSELHLDVHRRCVTFKAEIGKLQSNGSLDDAQRTSMIQQRFAAVFSPVFLALEKRLRSTLSKEPQTPNEQDFYELFAGELTCFIGKLKDMVATDVSQIQHLWAPIKDLIKSMDAQLKTTQLQLKNVSPKLADFSGGDVPMPGCQGDLVTVSGFGPSMLLLSTKTRPKKLEMIGSDGKQYSFLLKGRDDLHMDQRLMQFVSWTNLLLRKDQQTGPQEYCAREYSVTPLGGRVGLIQWVPQTVSLYGIFRSWQSHQLEKCEYVNSTQDIEPKNVVSVPTAAHMRPTDLYYSHLFPELKKAKVMLGTASRKEWPLEVMTKVNSLSAQSVSSFNSNAMTVVQMDMVF